MKYSLANYILNISCNDQALSNIFNVISVGGEGSATDSISISLSNNLWSTTGFATGGWVHQKNLSKVGTASITLNQLSKNVGKFIQLCNVYYSGDYEGLTITLTNSLGEEIAKCEDCFIVSIPSQEYASSASNQTWTFTCGKINFN